MIMHGIKKKRKEVKRESDMLLKLICIMLPSIISLYGTSLFYCVYKDAKNIYDFNYITYTVLILTGLVTLFCYVLTFSMIFIGIPTWLF